MCSIDDVFKDLVLLELCLHFNPVRDAFKELIQAGAELFDLFEDLCLLLEVRPVTQYQEHKLLSLGAFKPIKSLSKVEDSELLNGCLQKLYFCFLWA